MSQRTPVAGLGRLAAIVVTIVVVLVLTLYGVFSGLSYSRVAQADRGWADRLGTLEDVLERYPSRDCNPAAIELERDVARLGLDLSPRGLREVAVDDAAADALRDVASDIGKYVDRELERARERPQPPKRRVAAWLDANEDAIDAVVARLVGGETPRWTLRLERLHAATIPNLTAHMQLQRIFAADALRRAARGETTVPLARLEAAWRLNEALADDPVLITHLISMFGLRMQVGVLRHVDAAPPEWRRRVAAARPLERLLPALELEAWLWNEFDTTAFSAKPDGIQRAVWGFVAPYVRACAADVSDRMRIRLERLRRLDFLCDRDLTAREADLTVDVPFWNRLGGLMATNLDGATARAARLAVDLELTAQVLALRAERERGAAWAASASRGVPSAACPGDRWDHRFRAGDEVTIAFSRELSWPDMPGYELPTRFVTGR